MSASGPSGPLVYFKWPLKTGFTVQATGTFFPCVCTSFYFPCAAGAFVLMLHLRALIGFLYPL